MLESVVSRPPPLSEPRWNFPGIKNFLKALNVTSNFAKKPNIIFFTSNSHSEVHRSHWWTCATSVRHRIPFIDEGSATPLAFRGSWLTCPWVRGGPIEAGIGKHRPILIGIG